MKAVILAAGYATRLYPLTLDRPKHLLEVGGRPILDLLLDRLPVEELETVYVVTNSKFAPRFREWAESHPAGIEVIDDGTTSEDDRLGAIGDLQLAISTGIDDDLLVAAGDSLFSEHLDGFVRFARERAAPVIAAYDVGDLEEIKRLSAIEVDDDARVTAFEEKPERPASTLAGIALYFYPRSLLPLVASLTTKRIGQLWIDHTGHDTSRVYGTSTKSWRFDTVGIMAPLPDKERHGADGPQLLDPSGPLREPDHAHIAQEEDRHQETGRDHVDVFGEVEEHELEARILGVVAADQLLLGLRQVERQPARLGVGAHQK